MLKKLAERYNYSLILLKELVITDFKLRYQGSLLGYVWSLLRPLALFVILYFVFVKFLRIGDSVPHFPVYLLLGIVLWNYFAEVTNGGVSAIVGRGDLIRKLNFPKYVIVLSGSCSALINLALNSIVVGVFMWFNGVDLTWNIVWVPLLIIELFVLALAVAFFLSAIFVRLRDVNYIWEVIMQGAFYATPIIYPLSAMSVEVAKILSLNPMAQIIQDMRYAVITQETLTISDLYGSPWVRLVPIAFVIILAITSMWYFRRRSKHFAEEV
jgi:ABC-2 type transport system permease protein